MPMVERLPRDRTNGSAWKSFTAWLDFGPHRTKRVNLDNGCSTFPARTKENNAQPSEAHSHYWYVGQW